MTIGSDVRAVSPQISESSDFLPTDEAQNEAQNVISEPFP